MGPYRTPAEAPEDLSPEERAVRFVESIDLAGWKYTNHRRYTAPIKPGQVSGVGIDRGGGWARVQLVVSTDIGWQIVSLPRSLRRRVARIWKALEHRRTRCRALETLLEAIE